MNHLVPNHFFGYGIDSYLDIDNKFSKGGYCGIYLKDVQRMITPFGKHR